MAGTQYNYASAFALYVQGIPLEEASLTTQIPIDALKSHARHNSWLSLSKTVHSHFTTRSELAATGAPTKQGIALEKLLANREANLEQAVQIRKLADHTIQAWTRECEELDDKGRPCYVSPKSLRELACALATIHELTYRALGDHQAKASPTSTDKPAGSPSIVINLPGILANPRVKRTVNVEAVSDAPSTPEMQIIDNVAETPEGHNP